MEQSKSGSSVILPDPYFSGQDLQDRILRWIVILFAIIVSILSGAFTFMQVGNWAFDFIDAFAPGYIYACCPPSFNSPEEVARKVGWGRLLFFSAVSGAIANGSSIALLLILRVMNAFQVSQAYLIFFVVGMLGIAVFGSAGFVPLLMIVFFSRRDFVSVLKAYLIIFVTGILGACLGGGVGYLLGVATPGYYRGVFSSGKEAWFDPLQVGIGLGISQGLFAGLFIGAIISVAVMWYRVRMASKPGQPQVEIEKDRDPEGK